MNLSHRSIAFVLSLALTSATLTGCNYYEIVDPNTGDLYYTTQQKTYKGSGATKFKDAVTGQQVTLTGHKVRKMKGEAWKAAVEAQKAP